MLKMKNDSLVAAIDSTNNANYAEWDRRHRNGDLGLTEQWEAPETDRSQWQKIQIPCVWSDYDSNIKHGSVWFARDVELTKEQARAGLAMIEKQAKRRAHLEAYINRFRYKATKAKQAQSRLKMLERMGDAPKIPIEKSVRFTFPEPELLDAYLYTLENVSCGYNDKPVLQNIDLTIGAEDKIALLGANGNGKSTLAKIISNEMHIPIICTDKYNNVVCHRCKEPA